MDISVYTQSQDHLRDIPAHKASRTLAKLVLAAELGEKIGQNAMRLLVDLEWREVKTLARLAMNRKHLELLPELPYRSYPANEICLDSAFQRTMRYPLLLAKDQRTRSLGWAS